MVYMHAHVFDAYWMCVMTVRIDSQNLREPKEQRKSM